ncbi:M56 family metallopeptidase [Cognaticolwellia aestuarii]|uniref:M56 family metallopeptidase n=1 Tax=Cognaticolwellia aestuarii TaxID=329993 RepID=UPI000984C772|nr:M56 family metallopeptidase [Cognaticolwellia aestuarii]
MIEGQLAIWLNISTILVLSFIIANFSVSVFISILAQQFLTIQVESRKIILWLLVILPWLASISVALLFLNGYMTSTIFDSEAEYAHWHHMSEFNWLSWHGATLMIALSCMFYLVANKLIKLNIHRKKLLSLTSLSQPIDNNIFEIQVSNPGAFTAGFIRKKCFITSGMLKEMTREEVNVILGHEKAHAQMNDPLKKWLFSVFCEFFIPTLAKHLKLHMMLAMEQAADNAVVTNEVPSTFVAGTLVKVARLNANYTPLKENELVVNFGADILEQRVYFLLGQLTLKPANKWLTALFITLIFIGILSSIDGVHHIIETVFSH